MKIAEYKQVDTKIEIATVLVDDFDEMGEVVGQHEETVTKEIPIMGMVYRDMTPEEEAEALAEQARHEAEEANREPTIEERIEAQVIYTALMTDTLLVQEE